MHVYKLKSGPCEIYKIDCATFEQTTLRRTPYYKNNEDGTASQFAVCPACNGPIQIIGLYTTSDKAPRPYGRHFSKSITELAEYNQENYENCPYANPGRQRDKTSRRTERSSLSKEILTLLKENFDYVLEIISADTGIIITENLAKSMLAAYLGEQGYRYTGATLMNIPWIFAYMSDSQSLFGRVLLEQSNLAGRIRQGVDGITLNEHKQVSKSERAFLSINFCFIEHKTKLSENNLKEGMRFVVSVERKGKNAIVFEQALVFDHERFQRLLRIPADKAKRKKHFLQLATDMINI